jgi:hypothetical protein
MKPYKPDVKGFDFMKATTSQAAKDYFDVIVKNRILETDLPDVAGIVHDVREFEGILYDSIDKGETKYLPLGNAKELEAYKNPYSQQGVRGAMAWNLIYPDRAIQFPSKVSMLKLNIFTPEDALPLRDEYPEVYETIMTGIFGSYIKEVAEKGVQIISIPSGYDIPMWCRPFIDRQTVVNNILGQFKGVLDTFGIQSPEIGKSMKTVNRKTKKFTNVVRF